ncbi:MAG: DNA repair protein RadC [Nanoarchaeota archaeon]|nr:DNA repair protein RadC [Nanoarchaeota archaeon]
MKIKDLPQFNRPGFKLTRNGVGSLDDAELLSIIFGIGSKEESALELANRLLKKYNFNKLEDLSVNDLAKECNNNFNKALQLLSLIEICKRYNTLISGGYCSSIKSANDVFNIYRNKFINSKKEYVVVLYLNIHKKIIKQETVSIGILDASLIHPREIFSNAIKENASSIVLVHNHPSGEIEPSEGDKNVTEMIKEAGKIIKINLIDHIIIGNNNYYSFRESGTL